MTISQIKKETKAALSGNWGLAIGAMILSYLITALLSATFVGTLFSGVVSYGLISIWVLLLSGMNAKIDNLFDFTKNAGPVIIASVLKYIFILLWTMLFFIPGIVKSYSYAMTEYLLLVDPSLDGGSAITESRKMMNGKKASLFLLDLSFLGWYILSVFTFGILLLYVYPYHSAARAKFYESVYSHA